MKLFLPLFLLMFSANLKIEEVRKQYTAAARSEANAKVFADNLSALPDDSDDKTLLAYKGCSLTLQSKFSGYLPDKISFMRDGAKLMDAAAVAEPNNVEIRMIRLSVQENVPMIVGYKDNIDSDKALILKNFNALDKPMKTYIRNFMKQSKSFTAAEIKAAK